MNGTGNPDQTAASGDGDALDPTEAARLLDQAGRRAQRQFDLRRPLFMLVAAVVVLVGYGALWFSVRDQDPYEGPSLGAIVAVYAAVIVVIGGAATIVQRATAGVSGRTPRRIRAEGAAIGAAFVATGVFQGALKYAGASQEIVYGVFPAAAPLVVVGATMAGITASREDWPAFGAALGVVAVGTGAAFAGPAGSWAVAGVGLFLVVVGYAAATGWRRSRLTVRR